MASTQQQGPGTPKDAGTALVDALKDAAKAIEEPKPDPKVVASVKLGWLLADLAAERRVKDIDGEPMDDAHVATSAKAQGRELRALIAELSAPVAEEDALLKALEGGTPLARGDHRLAAWRSELEAWAMTTDVNLARGLDLGERLCDLRAAGLPDGRGPLKDAVAAPIIRRLDALSTALPSHTGRGISASLRRWSVEECWTKARTRKGDGAFHEPDDAVLKAQVDLWRRLLVGEKAAKDVLEPENYLDAADRLAGKYVATAWLAIKKNQVLAWVAGALAVVGVVILALVAANGNSDGGGLVAGLSALLTAAGLTWKGLGGAVGKLAGRFEAPLWRAELDGAVCDAATLIAVPPPDRPSDERRKQPGGDYAGRAALAKEKVPA